MMSTKDSIYADMPSLSSTAEDNRQKKKSTKNTLTLTQKIQVLQLLDNGKKSFDIQKTFNICRSHVTTIRQSREKILNLWKSAGGGIECNKIKRLNTKAKYGDVNEKLFIYYSEMKAKNITPSRSHLVEQALRFAKEMGHHTFSASNGWWDSWKFRYLSTRSVHSIEAPKLNAYPKGNRKEYIPNILTPAQKAEALRLSAKGISSRQLAKDFGVGRTQILMLRKKNAAVMEMKDPTSKSIGKQDTTIDNIESIPYTNTYHDNSSYPGMEQHDEPAEIKQKLGSNVCSNENAVGFVTSKKNLPLNGVSRSQISTSINKSADMINLNAPNAVGKRNIVIDNNEGEKAAKRQKLASDSDLSLNENVTSSKELSLIQKVELLMQSHSGESIETLCKSYDIGKAQLLHVCKDEKNILRQWKSDPTKNESYKVINGMVWSYYSDMKKKNKNVGRSLLKTQAKHIADKLCYSSFIATDIWVNDWKDCYIKKKQSSGNYPTVLDKFALEKLQELESKDVQRKCRLTLDEKMKVLINDENGKSHEEIARNMCVHLTQIRYIVNHRANIIKRWLSNGSTCITSQIKKPIHSCTLDAKILEFYLQSKSNNTHVNGIQLQAQAMKIARDYDLKDFHATNRWLSRWRKRNMSSNRSAKLNKSPCVLAKKDDSFLFKNLHQLRILWLQSNPQVDNDTFMTVIKTNLSDLHKSNITTNELAEIVHNSQGCREESEPPSSGSNNDGDAGCGLVLTCHGEDTATEDLSDKRLGDADVYSMSRSTIIHPKIELDESVHNDIPETSDDLSIEMVVKRESENEVNHSRSPEKTLVNWKNLCTSRNNPAPLTLAQETNIPNANRESVRKLVTVSGVVQSHLKNVLKRKADILHKVASVECLSQRNTTPDPPFSNIRQSKITSRPKTKTNNVLLGVLTLIKDLDNQSLEMVISAARKQLDEN